MAEGHELDLIAKLQDPNSRNQAFSVLVNTHQERLYWHIRRMVLDHDDTDDILQNTFIKAFRALDNFRGDSQLYTWLYRIASNEALSFLKSKRLKLFVSFESAENHFAKHSGGRQRNEWRCHSGQVAACHPETARQAAAGVQHEIFRGDEIRGDVRSARHIGRCIEGIVPSRSKEN
jgi:RNA polymerase sigma factor (sigma-70 family)